VEALDARGFRWETILEGKRQWLLIHAWPVPRGLSATTVTAAIRIVPGYPAAALDMIYVDPPLSRTDGQAIPALSAIMIDGRTFQQWSRHYSPQNQWRIGLDDISSHLSAAEEWMRKAAA
jgi:hypothetical protein